MSREDLAIWRLRDRLDNSVRRQRRMTISAPTTFDDDHWPMTPYGKPIIVQPTLTALVPLCAAAADAFDSLATNHCCTPTCAAHPPETHGSTDYLSLTSPALFAFETLATRCWHPGPPDQTPGPCFLARHAADTMDNLVTNAGGGVPTAAGCNVSCTAHGAPQKDLGHAFRWRLATTGADGVWTTILRPCASPSQSTPFPEARPVRPRFSSDEDGWARVAIVMVATAASPYGTPASDLLTGQSVTSSPPRTLTPSRAL